MTLADAEAHARKNGYTLEITRSEPKLPKSRMNKTETEYGRILESRKLKGEVQEYRFEGISLAWGVDPVTGKPMRYTPDYYVETPAGIELHEVKGGHIFDRDLVRFRGCRACWPQFRFVMFQKKTGNWRQLF